MDLNQAIQKHAEWKYKLLTAITKPEPLDVATISKDNFCEVGKWLHGEAKTLYGKIGSHGKCLSAHAAFHIEAGKIAALINAKKHQEAERMLAPGTPYHEAAKKVGVAMIELKNSIAS